MGTRRRREPRPFLKRSCLDRDESAASQSSTNIDVSRSVSVSTKRRRRGTRRHFNRPPDAEPPPVVQLQTLTVRNLLDYLEAHPDTAQEIAATVPSLLRLLDVISLHAHDPSALDSSPLVQELLKDVWLAIARPIQQGRLPPVVVPPRPTFPKIIHCRPSTGVGAPFRAGGPPAEPRPDNWKSVALEVAAAMSANALRRVEKRLKTQTAPPYHATDDPWVEIPPGLARIFQTLADSPPEHSHGWAWPRRLPTAHDQQRVQLTVDPLSVQSLLALLDFSRTLETSRPLVAPLPHKPSYPFTFFSHDVLSPRRERLWQYPWERLTYTLEAFCATCGVRFLSEEEKLAHMEAHMLRTRKCGSLPAHQTIYQPVIRRSSTSRLFRGSWTTALTLCMASVSDTHHDSRQRLPCRLLLSSMGETWPSCLAEACRQSIMDMYDDDGAHTVQHVDPTLCSRKLSEGVPLIDQLDLLASAFDRVYTAPTVACPSSITPLSYLGSQAAYGCCVCLEPLDTTTASHSDSKEPLFADAVFLLNQPKTLSATVSYEHVRITACSPPADTASPSGPTLFPERLKVALNYDASSWQTEHEKEQGHDAEQATVLPNTLRVAHENDCRCVRRIVTNISPFSPRSTPGPSSAHTVVVPLKRFPKNRF